MPRNADSQLSAQVVLHPASGAELDPDMLVTRENVGDLTPSPEAAADALAAFARAGFEVGPLVGNSFSITADLGVFEEWFDREIEWSDRGPVDAAGEPVEVIPPSALPSSLRGPVHSVVFPPPPEFGPAEFFP